MWRKAVSQTNLSLTFFYVMCLNFFLGRAEQSKNEANQMIVLEWLFLTMDPWDICAAEPWQLGSQEAVTSIYLHHDSKRILLFLLLLLVRILWEFAKWKLYFRVPETVWAISTCIFFILGLLSFAFVERAECAGDSSSSEGVGKLPLPSTTYSPVPSISSRGVSWISEYFDPEVSSSAPNQGHQEETGMPQGAPGQETQPPVPPEIPRLDPPFISDRERFIELQQRFNLSFLGRNRITDLAEFAGRLERAVPIERNIEAALCFDGYSPEQIRGRITEIRGILFAHPTRMLLLSEQTLDRYLHEIQTNGTRQSTPYMRLVRAIRNSDLIL